LDTRRENDACDIGVGRHEKNWCYHGACAEGGSHKVCRDVGWRSAMTEEQPHRRAVVWIDHLKAKIFEMGLTGVSSSEVHAHLSSSHLHHHANVIGSGHAEQDPKFLAAIAKAVEACDDVLILGPGIEKTTLMHYLQSARPKLVLRLESSDHPSDDEIIALGRQHFGLSEPRA
jgi:hypothetical protein